MIVELGEGALTDAGFSVTTDDDGILSAINVPQTMEYRENTSNRRQTETIKGIITSQDGFYMLTLKQVTDGQQNSVVSMTVLDRVSFDPLSIQRPAGRVVPTRSQYAIKDNITDEIIGIAPTDNDKQHINDSLAGTQNICKRFILAFANSDRLIGLLRIYAPATTILDPEPKKVLKKEEVSVEQLIDNSTVMVDVHIDNAVPIIMAMLII